MHPASSPTPNAPAPARGPGPAASPRPAELGPDAGVVSVGGGNMARAIIEGALGAGLLPPDRWLVADPDPARRADFGALGVAAAGSAADAARRAPTPWALLLAVKPQVLGTVAAELRDAGLAEGRTVVSILAGVTIDRLASALPESAGVVRVMPNTPAAVGRGAAGVALGPGVPPEHRRLALGLFRSVGAVYELDEGRIDAFTAAAGSGPAYAFLLAEAMARSLEEQMGCDAPTARSIVAHTIAGAGELLLRSAEDPAELRRRVTSKGGATAEAIRVFKQRGLLEIVGEAMRACERRARELAG